MRVLCLLHTATVISKKQTLADILKPNSTKHIKNNKSHKFCYSTFEKEKKNTHLSENSGVTFKYFGLFGEKGGSPVPSFDTLKCMNNEHVLNSC